MPSDGRLGFFRNALSLAALASLLPSRASAQSTGKQFIKTAHAQQNAYSQAVVTAPGRTVWLAGQTGAVDDAGKPIADFEGQVRQIFHAFTVTLGQAGAKLSDIVYMTVFLKDIRYSQSFIAIRKELVGDNFPASAIINITALATPLTLIEVQAVAVVA
jgi:2-iminobutanoate/2-iminopropanoate deaminase